jgi:hypothetical protein
MVLFDKVINVTFTTESGQDIVIMCPKTGRKPTIKVSGQMMPQATIFSLELRITNFNGVQDLAVESEPGLSNIRTVSIGVGYSGTQTLAGQQAGESLSTINGQISNAFEETPGPDGVTVFQVLIGNYKQWNEIMLESSWDIGTSLSDVFSSLCETFGVTPVFKADSITLPIAFFATGKVKDSLQKLSAMYDKQLLIDYDRIIMMEPIANGGTTGVSHTISLVKSPPRWNGGAYDVIIPYNAAIRCGDSVTINSDYVRTKFAGFQLGATGVSKPPSEFTIISASFDFSTTGDENDMELFMLQKGS